LDPSNIKQGSSAANFRVTFSQCSLRITFSTQLCINPLACSDGCEVWPDWIPEQPSYTTGEGTLGVKTKKNSFWGFTLHIINLWTPSQTVYNATSLNVVQ